MPRIAQDRVCLRCLKREIIGKPYRRGHQVSACEKIIDQQVRADCIKGVGR